MSFHNFTGTLFIFDFRHSLKQISFGAFIGYIWNSNTWEKVKSGFYISSNENNELHIQGISK